MAKKININKLFKEMKEQDLLSDRSEYDIEDLQKAYPELSKTDAKRLYLKLQKWRKKTESKDSKAIKIHD